MKLHVLIAVFLYATTLNAQFNLSYQKDLASLRAILQNTPSYKAQIKGNKLTSYNALYNRLASDTVSNVDDYRYF